MPYFLNENYSGYLPENDLQEYSNLHDLKAALRAKLEDLKSWYEYPIVHTWESISGLRKSHFVHAKKYSEKHQKQVEPNITIFGVSEKDSFQLTMWVFVYWNED